MNTSATTTESLSHYQLRADAQKLAFAPFAFQAALALRDLGLLKVLADVADAGVTPEQVAALTKLPIYGVKILLESGMVTDLATLNDNLYRITTLGRFVLHDRMTRINMDFTADVCYRGMSHLNETIRTGKPAGLKELGTWPHIYAGLAHLPPKIQQSWFAFDHYYSDNLFPVALPHVFANKPAQVLDIGGNTGKFSLACARYNDTVHVSLLDLPGQIAVARTNIEQAGFTDRITCHPIDFLDASQGYPGQYDAIWMSQFLDCFSEAQIVSILERAARVLKPDGQLFIVDSYWDRQAHAASRFCLVMTSLYFACMANGTSKMYHSDDMRGCVIRAGLRIEREIDNISLSHTLFICRRA